MKVLFLIIGWTSLWNSCVGTKERMEAISTQRQDTISTKTDTLAAINFSKEIQPILQTRCSPCHFTGGKMYAKMPFDKAETILTHQPGVLRRIKEDPDAQKIKDFFRQNSK